MVDQVGGPVRARVIFLFALVLGLNGASTSTVGAVAPQLEHALHIGTTKIGLLSSVALLIGAFTTIPVGLMVDRIRRMPLLAIGIVLWSLASLLGAFAPDYSSLLLSRLLLGAVVATAGPAIASLTGDFFPARERGNVYAYILGGEIAGNALGFLVCGTAASIFGWRAAFAVMAPPGLWLAWVLYRTVPEPHRGGQSHLEEGAERFVRAGMFRAQAARADSPGRQAGESEGDAPIDDLARRAVQRMGVEAEPARVLREDPRVVRLPAAVRYILSVPTNLLMIFSSSLGYFYFAGLSTFALLFIRGRYHAGQAEAELFLGVLVGGALVGTLIAGRATDMMLRRGMTTARVWVPAACYLAAVVALLFGLLGSKVSPAIWLDALGAGLLSAANPPLNAARLDTMPAGLWGRAESTRTLIRSLAEALAPLLFGAVAALVAGFTPRQSPIGTNTGHVGSTHGLQIAFLALLATLLAAGAFLLRARATYPQDVANAAASDEFNRSRVGRPAPA